MSQTGSQRTLAHGVLEEESAVVAATAAACARPQQRCVVASAPTGCGSWSGRPVHCSQLARNSGRPAGEASPLHVPLPRADVIVPDTSTLTSKRQRTALRANMNLYKWRQFVDTDAEAVSVESYGKSLCLAVQAVCLLPCCAHDIRVPVCACVCVRVCGSVCVMLQALSDRVETRTARLCIIISAAVCRARAVVFSRSLVHMGTCDVERSCQADVPADLYQYIGDPRAPGDPLHGTLGYRQPQDPAASQAFQAASLAARGLSTAQASSSSRQPAAA